MIRERPHHKLEVWREGVELVGMVYRISIHFPQDERYGLTSQMRRSAVSIPSNLAEGSARHSRKELANFVSIARGSLAELETQLLIARKLRFCEADDEIDAHIDRLYAKLNKLHTSLTQRAP